MALLVYAAIVLCVIYLRYRWSRTKLYELAAKIPGPKSYPIIGSAYKFFGNDDVIAKSILKCQEEGDIIKLWVGPRLMVMISSPDYAEIILNHPECLAKADVYKFADPFTGVGIGSSPVHIWKKNRKIIAPAFKTKILENYTDIIVKETNYLLNVLQREQNNVDACRYFVNWSVNVFVVAFLGLPSFDAQQGNFEYDHLIDNGAKLSFLRVCKVWLHNDFIFEFSDIYKQQSEVVKVVKAIITKILDAKKQCIQENGYSKRPFPDGAMKDGTISEEQMFEEFNTFFIAGSDTSSNTVTFCLTLLSMNPDIQEKLYQEVIDVLGPDRVPNVSDLPHLKYTECVLKETLRILPTIPNIARETNSDIDLGDYIIPSHTQVVVGIWTIHRSEKFWKDPLKFDPDRFLPENSAGRHPYSWIPFAAGPRNCIGLKFAMLVMKISLAMIIRRFRVTSPYKCLSDIEITTNVVLKCKDKLRLSFEPR